MAKYLLTGHVLDQQESALVGKEVLLQRMYFPHTTENGVVMGQELWITTGSGGAIPAGFYLVPGLYRVECRVGAVVNKAYLLMPDDNAVLEEVLITVSEEETVLGYFRTVAEVRLSRITYKLIWVRNSETNQDYGFWENKGDVGTDDGETYIVNATGVVYTRRQ